MKASAGGTHHGGEDFENRIVEFSLQEFKHKNRDEDMEVSLRAIRLSRSQSEREKHTLSFSTGHHHGSSGEVLSGQWHRRAQCP